MKKIMTVLALMCACVANGGVIITLENDFMNHTDDSYSNGAELEWLGDTVMERRVGYGIHQLMYTPTDISDPDNQPLDRPWCGILTAFREVWSKQGVEMTRTRIEAGVLGPSALAEEAQKEVHRLIHNKLPQGWDNQMPDEPVLNLYHERHHPLMDFGKEDGLGVRLEALYGGTIGTTFINGFGGTLLRSGYNIQANSIIGGIEPKAASKVRPFLYLMLETDGMLVLHNATIGESFFREREPGHEQDLENCVGMYRYGVVGGYKCFTATYLMGMRTREFETQKGNTDWGLISLQFASQF